MRRRGPACLADSRRSRISWSPEHRVFQRNKSSCVCQSTSHSRNWTLRLDDHHFPMPTTVDSAEPAALPAAPDLRRRSSRGSGDSRRAATVRAHRRSLWPRRAAVSGVPRRAVRGPAGDRRLHRLRAGGSARLSRPSPRGRDRCSLASARALGLALARPPCRPRRRRCGIRARRNPGAEGGPAPAAAAERGRRKSRRDDGAARGRGARAVDSRPRRGGACALLRRGAAHLRGAFDPPRRGADRRARGGHGRRQGQARPVPRR